ncbi:MAG: type III pantothenate kinase [Pseudomonadota bacterium]
MTLLIDIGNSRIKWARAHDNGPRDIRAVDYRDDVATALAGISDDIDASTTEAIGASVGPVDVRDAMTDILAKRGVETRWLAVTREALGVTCGYRDTERLGVDRWVATLAGFQRADGAALVAQVGTAATIDAVKANGQHLGGMILPGLGLMATALYGKTARIRAGADALVDPTNRLEFFGNDTDLAVQNGCLLAVTAAIEAAYEALVIKGETPRVFLAGGASAAVAQQLTIDFDHEPALVLDGIRRLGLGEGVHA